MIQDAYLENYENQLEEDMERELEERERDRGNKGRGVSELNKRKKYIYHNEHVCYRIFAPV